MSDLVRISFACNDPDTGDFAGNVVEVHIHDGDPLLELETPWRPRRFFVGDGWFRLAGRHWPFAARTVWDGNRCWDAFGLPASTAADFLVWLHARRLFNCTCAETRLYNLWKRDTPLDRDFTLRLLQKAALRMTA